VSEHRVRAEIVEVGRRLYARGLIAANEGNISVRQGDLLYVTPAGVCKGFLDPETIVKTDLEGNGLEGGQSVSSEVQIHVAVYRRRPDALAVVHAHPPTATGFAAAGIALDRPLIAEAVVILGQVPVIPYATPSTAQLAENVVNVICEAHGLLMANHGALTVGETLFRAWERMEILEQLARVTLTTRLLGQGNRLREADVSKLEAMRSAAGHPPPACAKDPAGIGPAQTSTDDKVVLSRTDLVQLVADAVKRFGGA